MQNWFNCMEVEHLARTGSDHALMLLSMEEKGIKCKNPFRFLNFWTEHASFVDVVKQNWVVDESQNTFLSFKENIKRFKYSLSMWRKETYRDIFQKLLSEKIL